MDSTWAGDQIGSGRSGILTNVIYLTQIKKFINSG